MAPVGATTFNQMENNEMIKLAQTLAGLLALFLASSALLFIFNPSGAASALGMTLEPGAGLTNMRANGAPMLMMAIASALGARTKKWEFLLPVALCFVLITIIRLLGLALDGFGPGTLRGLALAALVFGVAEFSLQVFRKSERRQAEI